MGCCASKKVSSEPPADKVSVPKTSADIEPVDKHTASPSAESNLSKEAEEVKAQSSAEEESDLELSESSAPTLNDQHAEFEARMARKREEIEAQKRRLTARKSKLFLQQVESQKKKEYKRLHDVFMDYATSTGTDEKVLNIDGLESALEIFGMVIDNGDPAFRRHVFKKFDIDDEGHITWADFSATMATFVNDNTDEKSLQDLFEIFDMDEDGCLTRDEIAALLLAQNHIMLVSTGSQHSLTTDSSHEPWSEEQCLKYAKRLILSINPSSVGFNKDKISFDNFMKMMSSRTNQLMLKEMRPPTMSMEISFDLDPADMDAAKGAADK